MFNMQTNRLRRSRLLAGALAALMLLPATAVYASSDNTERGVSTRAESRRDHRITNRPSVQIDHVYRGALDGAVGTHTWSGDVFDTGVVTTVTYAIALDADGVPVVSSVVVDDSTLPEGATYEIRDGSTTTRDEGRSNDEKSEDESSEDVSEDIVGESGDETQAEETIEEENGAETLVDASVTATSDTVSDEDTSESGEEAEDASENGEDASENGEDASENGEDASENGEDASENGEDASENGEDASENGEDASENGEDASENGEDASENEEVADEDLAEETGITRFAGRAGVRFSMGDQWAGLLILVHGALGEEPVASVRTILVTPSHVMERPVDEATADDAAEDERDRSERPGRPEIDDVRDDRAPVERDGSKDRDEARQREGDRDRDRTDRNRDGDRQGPNGGSSGDDGRSERRP